MNLQTIFDDCQLSVDNYHPVHGGDINESFCLQSHDKKYFLKVNESRRYPAMFKQEADGLAALRNGSSIKVPKVIRSGVIDTSQYLLLEWMEAGRPNDKTWEEFGMALAMMHRQPQPYFGWEEDNYIGSLYQSNTIHSSWSSFYSGCRIIPLVERLYNAGSFTQRDAGFAVSLCKKLDELFPKESPSLLHGDLWSGNYMISQDGKAAFFDPAVYYGHREMDIGMSLLFGGFNQLFYERYRQAYPLESGWQQRLQLCQLYPLLVHAVLFGGHYIGNCREIIRRFA